MSAAMRLAAGQPDAVGAPPCTMIWLDFGVAAHRAALPFDQLDQAAHQPAGAAHREMHAPALFQMAIRP